MTSDEFNRRMERITENFDRLQRSIELTNRLLVAIMGMMGVLTAGFIASIFVR